jgi:hypothetical protein
MLPIVGSTEQFPVRRIYADRAGAMDRAHRRRMIEALADLPWLFHVAHAALQVSPRHVEADRISEHMLERALDRDISAAPRMRGARSGSRCLPPPKLGSVNRGRRCTADELEAAALNLVNIKPTN